MINQLIEERVGLSMEMAIFTGNIDVVKRLCKEGVVIDRSHLLLAEKHEDLQILGILLEEKGYDG